MVSRQQLRAEIRQRRNSLTKQQQSQAAAALSSQVETYLNSYGKTRQIAIYLANDGEIATDLIIAQCKSKQVLTALPVLHPFRDGYLNFQNVNDCTEWTKNKYKIKEPKLDALNTVPLNEIDIVFLPLVAFDAQGNRLGMGGGYYDRTLSHINRMTKAPSLVGLAHDCQQVESLPLQSWDIPINSIITPSQIIQVT